MKIMIALILGLIVNINSSAQLDPFYFGTYMNQDFTESYTIYYLDETTEDCFLVEYEMYEDYQIIFSESGFGICEENGETKIKLESAVSPRIVEFKLTDGGLKIMAVLNENGLKTEFSEFSEFESMESQNEEIYFSRLDGAELMIFPDGDQLGFTFYGLLDKKCESNEFTGVMIPKNEELTLLEYSGENGCKIEFQVTTNNIKVVEENCSALRNSSCADWNGYYTMNQ